MQIALFPLCLALLAIRGATGVVAIYIPYESYWIEDRKFYPLDTLPEFLCLVVQCWPCLMARMAQSWPKGRLQDKKGKVHDSEQARSQQEQGNQANTSGSQNKQDANTSLASGQLNGHSNGKSPV